MNLTMNCFKRRWMAAAFIPALTLGLTACGDDDEEFDVVDGDAPTITLATDHIQAEPGSQFTIKGAVKDADGIKSITMKSEGLLLDKTIDLLFLYPDSLFKEYELAYNYKAEKEWTDDSSFPVEIVVTDVLGNQTKTQLTVTGDGDYTNPAFSVAPSHEITVLVGARPKLKLNCTATDNKALKSVTFKSDELGINDVVETGKVKSFEVSKEYILPAGIEATYKMTITAVDQLDNEVKAETAITVSEMPDFEKMYLADVETAAELSSDVYGVPMLIDHTGEYEYTARYYNQKAGTRVRFIPQMTDFEPICFGPDAENTSVFANDPSVSQGLVLSEVAYYEIKFNTKNGTYSAKTYVPTPVTVTLSGKEYTYPLTLNGTTTMDFGDGSGDQPAQICLAGSNLPDGAGNWTTNQNAGAYILQQDAQNPYLLYREGEYEEGKQIEFTISQTHWWGWWPEPFWRFDGSDNNEKNVLNGGDNMKKMTVPATGKYRFEFDYHLLRSRLYPVK